MNLVTLKRLAEELNLSIATVSRALHDSHEVSAATKARVLELAAALQYEPNAYASSLRRNVSKTIGVVIPKVANHFFSLAINGIEEVARQSGYHVLIYLTHDSYAREVAIVRHLRGRVDGLLLSVAAESQDFAHLRELHKHLPLVFFDRVCEELPAASVTTNDYASGYQATRHLLDAGCRRVAHLLISGNLSIGRHRMEGYRAALQDYGLPADDELIVRGVTDNAQNVTLIRELLLRRPDVDGIFASVERLAVSSYHVCRSLGRAIPGDVKIIGFSNLESVSLFEPPLSTVTQPAYEMGREAAIILMKLLEKKKAAPTVRHVVIDSVLHERASTASTDGK